MGRRTIERPSDGKKISSRESEDLQELSAGSDDSEELPDPTAATYRRPAKPVKSACLQGSANCTLLSHAAGGGTSVRPRRMAA